MSATTFTPGPWQPDLDKLLVMATGRDEWVADCLAVHRPCAENEANARLIATAPDLLAACRAALAKLDDVVGVYTDGAHILRQLQAVIRKAEGRTP